MKRTTLELLLTMILVALTAFMAVRSFGADSPDEIERRLIQYRTMFYEVEFHAEVEELEYLQRKIRRLELDLETANQTGSCKSFLELN